jgi:hypothetical protein
MVQPLRIIAGSVSWPILIAVILAWAARRPANLAETQRRVAKYWIGTVVLYALARHRHAWADRPVALPAAGRGARRHPDGHRRRTGTSRMTSTHPRHDLDDLLIHAVRFSIAALVGVDRAEFGLIRDSVDISDSMLSKQIALLRPRGTSVSTRPRRPDAADLAAAHPRRPRGVRAPSGRIAADRRRWVVLGGWSLKHGRCRGGSVPGRSPG